MASVDSHHSGFLSADSMKLEDVGLNPEMSCFRTEAPDEAPKITYLHLYECEKFSVSWFLLGATVDCNEMGTPFRPWLSYVFTPCRLGSSACLHRVSFRFIIILEWRFSVNFSSGLCTSSHMTGQLIPPAIPAIHLQMPILHKVSFPLMCFISHFSCKTCGCVKENPKSCCQKVLWFMDWKLKIWVGCWFFPA